MFILPNIHAFDSSILPQIVSEIERNGKFCVDGTVKMHSVSSACGATIYAGGTSLTVQGIFAQKNGYDVDAVDFRVVSSGLGQAMVEYVADRLRTVRPEWFAKAPRKGSSGKSNVSGAVVSALGL
jgi:hypothetical protein